jgi:hypothetical protein
MTEVPSWRIALKRFLVPLLISLSSFGAVTAVHADPSAVKATQPVRIELKAFRITTAAGKEQAVEAKQARPSDIIEYRASYANTSKTAVKGLMATLPIPVDMQYTGVATPASAEASTDGKLFASMPLVRQVGGKVVQVPLSEYRALRWRVAELQVGKTVVVSARARVNGVSQ